MTTSRLVTETDGGFEPFGGAATFWTCADHEAIIAGPYQTGKTVTALHKLNAIACIYPNARILMARKTYRSLVESACVTYERKVLHAPPGDARCPVAKSGGIHPTAYEYPNGSRIVLGGMDKPSKLLSSEWDVIYVNQAEELSEAEWEALVGRATGRAGNTKRPLVMGDANPGPPSHWILKRKGLRLIESRHEDNPTLYDHASATWTAFGLSTLAILDNLTGVRYQRGRLGQWVAAEGQVYDTFDRAVHLIDRFDPPASWPRYWALDFGYTNPFVWQEWAEDGDGRLYLYREIYRTRTLVEDHARDIMALTAGQPAPVAVVCDHDAEDRATFERHTGLKTTAAYKAVTVGIQAVQARMVKAGDGKPRLFVMRDALVSRDDALADAHKPVCTADEFEVYVWPKAADGRPVKEVPVKEFDHGLDSLRYLCGHVDNVGDTRRVMLPYSEPASASSGAPIASGIMDRKW